MTWHIGKKTHRSPSWKINKPLRFVLPSTSPSVMVSALSARKCWNFFQLVNFAPSPRPTTVAFAGTNTGPCTTCWEKWMDFSTCCDRPHLGREWSVFSCTHFRGRQKTVHSHKTASGHVGRKQSREFRSVAVLFFPRSALLWFWTCWVCIFWMLSAWGIEMFFFFSSFSFGKFSDFFAFPRASEQN